MENVIEWVGFVLGSLTLVGGLIVYISKKTKTEVDDKIGNALIEIGEALEGKLDKPAEEPKPEEPSEPSA